MEFSASLWSSTFLPNRTNSFPTTRFSSTNHKPPTAFAIPPISTATAVDDTTIAIAVIGRSSMTAFLSIADPERQRRLQAEELGYDKEVMKEYFPAIQRNEVNLVQRETRLGHSKRFCSFSLLFDWSLASPGSCCCYSGGFIERENDVR